MVPLKKKIEQKGWGDTIIKEFDTMTKRKVLERIKHDQVPKERRTIGSKWVSKRKRYGRYEARLCGLDYTQIAGIDFTTNFAPVVNDITFRILLVWKMIMGWDAELIKIETIFLHGTMEEKIILIYLKVSTYVEEETKIMLKNV